MNLTQEQIEKEFERQVRLCSGIGREKQRELLETYWATLDQIQKEQQWKDLPGLKGNSSVEGAR